MDTHFPDWSYKIVEIRVMEFWAIAHVRIWATYPNGVKVERDAIDAHLIQRKREGGALVDPGNDIKGAVSDALKKGFSLFGIAADVYKFVEPVLDDEQIEHLLKRAELIGKRDIFEQYLEDGQLHLSQDGLPFQWYEDAVYEDNYSSDHSWTRVPNVEITTSGDYHLVFSNRASPFISKIVTADIRLIWTE